MRFIVDENLPARVAVWLRTAGHEAWHVSGLGLLGQSDDRVWSEVCDRAAYIITRDRDFRDRIWQDPNGGVVRLLIGNCSTPVLIARLEILWPEVERRIALNARLVEIG